DTTGRRKRGLCAVPEERNGHAAVGDFSLSDNSVLTARDRLGMVMMGLINSGAAHTYTGKVIADFAVKALGPASMAGSLSGGNLQKYIMGREILQKPGVLVRSEEHTSELQSRENLVCRLLLEKKKKNEEQLQ